MLKYVKESFGSTSEAFSYTSNALSRFPQVKYVVPRLLYNWTFSGLSSIAFEMYSILPSKSLEAIQAVPKM